MSNTPDRERVLGCLLGGALGDALGYPLEFMSVDEIRTQCGEVPEDLTLAPTHALVSDDTQMTLFSAEAAIRARAANSSDIVRYALGAYQRWFTTQEMRPGGEPRGRQGQGALLADSRLYHRRAPGNTCLSSLAMSYVRAEPGSVTDPPNYSKGCGAVMRSAPFGVVASSREEAFRSARDAAALTHGHPSGFLSGAYLASLVYDLVRRVPLREAMAAADQLLVIEKEHEEVRDAVASAQRIATARGKGTNWLAQLGEGWVGEEALAMGLACALVASPDTVAQALWQAVAHGGDSDSVGSIAGNLIGALYGVAALPVRWQEQVELSDLIRAVAEDLYSTAAGRSVDATAYPPAHGAMSRLS